MHVVLLLAFRLIVPPVHVKVSEYDHHHNKRGFIYFEGDDARSLVNKWKPHQFELKSSDDVAGIDGYVRSILLLNDTVQEASVLLSEDSNLFVVTIHKRKQCELKCCLWQPGANRSEVFRSFRIWLFDRGYGCTSSLNGDDLQEWYKSAM